MLITVASVYIFNLVDTNKLSCPTPWMRGATKLPVDKMADAETERGHGKQVL